MKEKLPFIYFLVLVLEIISGELGRQDLVYFLKPCLMILLIIYVGLYNPKKHILFILALFFSLLGDILLMFNLPSLFVFGLGCFLVTHIFYISVFYKDAKYNLSSFFIFITLLLLCYVFIINKTIPRELITPVIIYTVVILSMFTTLNAVQTRIQKSNLLVIGAVLFIISDGLIAINKFFFPIPYPTLLIMSTYGVAQYMITKGYLKLKNVN